ncbi:MAG TPA: ATP synthase subunit I [Gammaproteobacteria bacterium]|nr:ATP synthase subunit I [Gammaproteobacteria bacterium]
MDDSRVVPLTLLGQAGVTLCLGAGLWLWLGQVAGVSALLGGATAVIPNGFLAARLLQRRTGAGGTALLRSAWIGEIGKWLLTAVLFAAIFGAVRPLEPLAVFGGFIAAQMVIFAALLLGGARRKEA